MFPLIHQPMGLFHLLLLLRLPRLPLPLPRLPLPRLPLPRLPLPRLPLLRLRLRLPHPRLPHPLPRLLDPRLHLSPPYKHILVCQFRHQTNLLLFLCIQHSSQWLQVSQRHILSKVRYLNEGHYFHNLQGNLQVLRYRCFTGRITELKLKRQHLFIYNLLLKALRFPLRPQMCPLHPKMCPLRPQMCPLHPQMCPLSPQILTDLPRATHHLGLYLIHRVGPRPLHKHPHTSQRIQVLWL